MILFSFGLLLALVLSAPVWGWRMLRQERYRKGMRERLGQVPQRLLTCVQGRPVVWVHAVSVGETLAAERMVRELAAALPGYAIVLSTTTPTGQQVARERFGADRVFYYPLDFAFSVRAYLRALRPSLLVLMESELWPRMLHECASAGIPVAVVNARVSDRSLPRYRALRAVWRPLLRKISLLLAQSESDAERWESIGVPADRVRTTGNLKYDTANDPSSPLAELVRRSLPEDARVVVAGSTHPGEDAPVLRAYAGAARQSQVSSVLILAPRHTERSADVHALATECGLEPVLLSEWRFSTQPLQDHAVLLIDTVGELASLYALATCAFIGGSLVNSGGHNPLEAAQFSVPVATGPHFQNFRTMLEGMVAQNAITIVPGEDALEQWFLGFLQQEDETDDEAGARARAFYEQQRGATARVMAALVPLATRTRT
ncbi:3-deoxy-D-manno-octulosonic acid transferase [Terriglobus aquaticus]|uniref:3-deoxy-D-manno-octulosonic acid transferase n=1 Tax=Terriglobus aquaticus TaxID=940139 RepID=A0ABW9KFD7_9BACT|nr:3-deoxy-D-manno-octulosonic acid transferase [Terriglobus aquaticus]